MAKTTSHSRHRCIALSSQVRTSASCTNREASGFPVAGASESIMFSVALVSKQPNTNIAFIVAILDPPVHISTGDTEGRLSIDEFYDCRFPIVSAKRQPVSPPIRRKEGRGRPSTPFIRERILLSAAELFAEREFELVLIDEVAAHAGVGKGSVYRQFKSKEELYAAAVIDGFTELQREIRSALAGCTSMREQIATIVRHSLRFFWSRRRA